DDLYAETYGRGLLYSLTGTPQNSRDPALVLRRAREAVEEPSPVSLRVQIVDDPEVENYAQGFSAVFPSDLLAFFVGAPVVADGNFVDTQLAFGHLHGDLGLEAETVAADRNALQQVGAEDFVAGLHVGH